MQHFTKPACHVRCTQMFLAPKIKKKRFWSLSGVLHQHVYALPHCSKKTKVFPCYSTKRLPFNIVLWSRSSNSGKNNEIVRICKRRNNFILYYKIITTTKWFYHKTSVYKLNNHCDIIRGCFTPISISNQLLNLPLMPT